MKIQYFHKFCICGTFIGNNRDHERKGDVQLSAEIKKSISDTVILVIEDDSSIRNAINTLLSRKGYTVIEANHGREGLAILEDFGVDLVITDIFMPNMDGLEVIRNIRKKNKELRVIAISGGGQMHLTESLRWAAAFGADKTLNKPIKHTELLDAVEALTMGNSSDE